MPKYAIGDDVIFEGSLAVVRKVCEYVSDVEYAIEFYFPELRSDAWGCVMLEGEELEIEVWFIPRGKGRWVYEECLKTLK